MNWKVLQMLMLNTLLAYFISGLWNIILILFSRKYLTDPALLGQREIWDALKAAAAATETGDNSLAQAIIDGANISLPHGNLNFT